MGLKEKTVEILQNAFAPEYARLDDEGGITGFVVAPAFRRMTSLDRQYKIDEALAKASLSRDERRQIVMIAALTPEEYEFVGNPIRIYRVKELTSGALEIVLQGPLSDANYVRKVLTGQNGIKTTVPRPREGIDGILMSFRAKGSDADPLTKEKAKRILKKDKYIEVMAKS